MPLPAAQGKRFTTLTLSYPVSSPKLEVHRLCFHPPVKNLFGGGGTAGGFLQCIDRVLGTNQWILATNKPLGVQGISPQTCECVSAMGANA